MSPRSSESTNTSTLAWGFTWTILLALGGLASPPAVVAETASSAKGGRLARAVTRRIVRAVRAVRQPVATPVPSPAPSPAPSGGSSNGDIQSTLDIPYVTRDGVAPKLLSLDVYRPAAASGAPVMVFVHGGGWRRGDKGTGSQRNKIEGFTAAGYVMVLVNYRLAPAAQHPAGVSDVAASIAWVHDHIAEYGGDAGAIFVMGHSAGAHLAALVSTDGRYLEEVGKSPSIVRGTVCLDTGDYDLVRAVETDPGSQKDLIENAFGTDPAVWADASPINHAVAGLAPFDLLHIQSPRKQQQAQSFSDRLQAVGVSTEIYEVKGADHEDVNQNMGLAGDPATVQVMGFLDSVRQGKAAAKARPGKKTGGF